MTPKCRHGILLWIDALGKWSLIDLYVLVLFMVAFGFHITTPSDLDYLPPDFLDLKVLVRPGWGIYGFLIATVISLVTTHILLHFHRMEEQLRLSRDFDNNAVKRRSIMSHNFVCFSGWDSRKYV